MQYDAFVTKKMVGSEDCLYLNVFVPQVQILYFRNLICFILFLKYFFFLFNRRNLMKKKLLWCSYTEGPFVMDPDH